MNKKRISVERWKLEEVSNNARYKNTITECKNAFIRLIIRSKVSRKISLNLKLGCWKLYKLKHKEKKENEKN